MHKKFGDRCIRYRDPLDSMESTIHVVICKSIIEIVQILLDLPKKKLYIKVLMYVANTHDSWFLMKGAPHGNYWMYSKARRM